MKYTYSNMLGRNLIKVMAAVKLMARVQGATINDLMEGLGISRRSVYRLFDTLNELNFPLYEQDLDGRTKSWHLQEDFLTKLPNLDLPHLELTREEVLVLYLLISRGNILGMTELNHYIPSIRKKLEAFLPMDTRAEQVRKKLDDIFIPAYQGIKDYSGKEELLDDLMTAITEQRTCSAEYHSFSRDKRHSITFNPLKLFEWNGGFYAFIQLHPELEIRTIAVERLGDISLSEDCFAYPENFDAEAMLSSAFTITFNDPIRVKIWFDRSQANYIKEKRWAKNQSLTENDDESLILEMETSGVQDVKRWLLSFGPHAKVLEPESLAREIRDDISRMNKTYDL